MSFCAEIAQHSRVRSFPEEKRLFRRSHILLGWQCFQQCRELTSGKGTARYEVTSLLLHTNFSLACYLGTDLGCFLHGSTFKTDLVVRHEPSNPAEQKSVRTVPTDDKTEAKLLPTELWWGPQQVRSEKRVLIATLCPGVKIWLLVAVNGRIAECL